MSDDTTALSEEGPSEGGDEKSVTPSRHVSFLLSLVTRHCFSRQFFLRWLKFSVVGASGIVVQAATLLLLLRLTGMHYLVATAIAVETSVLNNFIWHRRWTWADRRESPAAAMLLRFNLTTGALSIIGNLVLMLALVAGAGLNAFAANMVTIAICSLVNFTLSDRFVFV